MAVKFNINNALSEFKKLGGSTKFPDSLKEVLSYMQNDKNLNTVNEVSWLLATAKTESDYSLQRWEADYVCGDAGVPYKDKPCQKAINYYLSPSHATYKGLDSNGLPYFGRGLIQLTHDYNYKTYGDIIGVNLIKYPDKAMIPKNSYRIASAYFKRKKVFESANKEDFAKARRLVLGKSEGWQEVKEEYDVWEAIFKKKDVAFKKVKQTKTQRRNNIILYSSVFVAVVGFSLTLYLATRKR